MTATRGADEAGLLKRLKAIETLRRAGELAAALQSCRQLHSAHPGRADIVFAMGALNLEMGRHDVAYPFLKRCVEMAPERGVFWLRLAACLHEMGQLEASRIAAVHAARRLPRDLNALNFLGSICRLTDDGETALGAFNTILAIKPDDETALDGKARSLMVLGRIDEAEAVLLKLLDINPHHFSAYQALLKNKSESIDPEQLRTLAVNYVNDAPEVGDNLISAYFSLFHLEDKEKNYDLAFSYLKKANSLREGRKAFDKANFTQKVDRLIEAYSAETLARLAGVGTPSEVPVFIVGMPRSGTTLTEQILSSHSRVHGAGELRKIGLLVQAMSGMALQGFRYPQDIARLDRKAFGDLGGQYLDVAMRNAPDGTARVVDKMPGNIIHMGFIGVMFPNATLIHCMRDPMDMAVSCYMQNFRDELSYANDLAAIGHCCRETLRLMDHWKTVFPGRILDVRYEETVADQEATSRRLIAHAGLDWEDRCLSFYETERSVQTASLWQVRQPIYRTSIERWRRYEKHLGPLIEALGEHAPQTVG